MLRGEDGDEGPELTAVADLDDARVHDDQAAAVSESSSLHAGDLLEVGVEALPDGDVAAVVDADGRLDECALAYVAHQPLQDGLSVLDDGPVRGVAGEVRVVFVHELAGSEPALEELLNLGVVSLLVRIAVWRLWLGNLHHVRDHLLVVVAPRGVLERLGEGDHVVVLLRSWTAHID